jgi:hypothetical protein
MIVATGMFYLSANGTLHYGRLDFDKYSYTITALLGILAAATSGITSFVFGIKR